MADVLARNLLKGMLIEEWGREACILYKFGCFVHFNHVYGNNAINNALQMRHGPRMKTATLLFIRVKPEFRHTVKSLLYSIGKLTKFVENAIRKTVTRRSYQAKF